MDNNPSALDHAWLTAPRLRRRARQLAQLQRPCRLCPRRCGVDREREPGFCGQPASPGVAAICAHVGEEPALCGEQGAGTVFLTGCTMRCSFCQNHQISHPPSAPGRSWGASVEQLAGGYLRLQRLGCANVEWVSPTSHLPQLVEALALAREQGLGLPVVYNTNGFDRVEVLRLLRGVVQVYLPDAKYATDQLARQLSQTADYVAVNRRAIQEMWRQVGPLRCDAQGIADQGLIVRHLVLPGLLHNTRQVLDWLAGTLGPQVCVSLMAQYFPTGPGGDSQHPGRRLTRREYRLATEALLAAGVEQGWIQQLRAWKTYQPDFHSDDPFAG